MAVTSESTITLHSRNRKSLNQRFPYIVESPKGLPDETVLDGELVALDDAGRPEFNLLQNFKGAASRVRYFIFDVLCYRGRDLTPLPLVERREYLERIPAGDRIKISVALEVSPETMIAAIREQGLEGVVEKRRDSRYERGKRSGAWVTMRVNRVQEFVIGGFIPGPHGLDSVRDKEAGTVVKEPGEPSIPSKIPSRGFGRASTVEYGNRPTSRALLLRRGAERGGDRPKTSPSASFSAARIHGIRS